jgi:hypothetical protein
MAVRGKDRQYIVVVSIGKDSMHSGVQMTSDVFNASE